MGCNSCNNTGNSNPIKIIRSSSENLKVSNSRAPIRINNKVSVRHIKSHNDVDKYRL